MDTAPVTVAPTAATVFDPTGFDPIAFLSRILAIPSCDPPGGELAVAQEVHAALLSLGIEATLDEFQPGRANVLGRIRGNGRRKSFVLSSHMDTVPPGREGWIRDPFSGTVEAGRVHGRGASDMKSALAAMIAAAGEIRAADLPLEGDLVLAFTAGESANLLGARRFEQQGLKAEIGAFLCGEPSGLDIIVVEKAVLWLRLVARGEIGHVSGSGGVNAISRMREALVHLEGFSLDQPAHPLLDAATLSINKIHGGNSINTTPDLCIAEIDIRLPPQADWKNVVARLSEHMAGMVEVELIEFKSAVEEKADSAFVAACGRVCAAVTGRAPDILGVSYYSDGAVLMDGVDASFAIIGPGDLGASGTANESCSVEKVLQAVHIYRDLAVEWLA